MLEVERRLTEASAGAESVKELLTRSKGVMSAELGAALLEAVNAVEAETNATVTLDGASAGYKKFAEKVKVRRERRTWRGWGQMPGWLGTSAWQPVCVPATWRLRECSLCCCLGGQARGVCISMR